MPIRCQNITGTIVGIGVGGVTHSTEQLALVVVGVGNSALSGGGVGGDITHGIIGIAILLPAAGHGRYLHGGLGAANIPVGILTGHRAAGDGGQAPQAIVAHGQGSAHTGGHGVQAAIGIVISVSFRVSSAAHLPSLLGQLVVRIVGLIGAKNAGISLLLLAVNQAANGIVGVVILLMTFGFIISSNINSSRVF